MATKRPSRQTLTINRAPVLTLWAAVVAERLGFTWEEALTLGRAVAGMNAYAKGKALGIFQPTPKAVREKRQAVQRDERLTVELLHRAVPVKKTETGLRALSRGKPMTPESVQRYIESKFGEALSAAYAAMKRLATSRPPSMLAAEAYGLYERFRPTIPAGAKGWGATGTLNLDTIRTLARKER